MRTAAALTATALTFLLAPLAGCGDSTATTGGTGGTPTTTTTTDSGMGGTGGAGGTTTTPTGPSYCEVASLPVRPWADGPYGTHRGDLADDFTVDLATGETWTFKDRYSGCESYVFLPDTLRVSDLDKTSIWTKDLLALIKASPKNAHYFFISRASTDEAAAASTAAMQAYVDETVAGLAEPDLQHWKDHLHVVSKRAQLLGNWLSDMLSGIGRGGFAIDRLQQIRGVGNLADVKRFKQALNDAGYWPWEQNLAYAAHEVRYFEQAFAREEKLAAEDVTVVPFYDGEVLAEFDEKEIDLPSEADMAKFDTLEVDITSMCPDPDKIEFGNCGAWDYLAYLFVKDDDGNNVELARFITSYHRETRWIVDASAMLVHLQKGGKRTFRWEFAPPWNTQPTATKLSLRFSNRNKGYRPVEATYLWGGGAFNAAYNDAHLPVDVPIPADAKHVELFTIITGHGAETGQCAEFCNHQHLFTVNGTEHKKEHKEAGTSNKCIDHIENGMVPNQGGTWWFGRGGWCPGEQVDPWIVDVTSEVTPGEMATITYEGQYKNLTPPDNAGNIAMTSYLVVYK
ncbi:MAG: peptide-N-glycosidase F-related protein [Polyangiaceae bacterium]